MTRVRRWWVVFAASAIATFIALALLTRTALILDSYGANLRADRQRDHLVRLALWRLDSALSPLIARETARPHYHYVPFFFQPQAFNKKWAPVDGEEVLVPSPLLGTRLEFFDLHFQLRSEGRMTSPQAPRGEMLQVALNREYADQEEIDRASELLGGLGNILRYSDLLETLREADVSEELDPPDLEDDSQEAFEQRLAFAELRSRRASLYRARLAPPLLPPTEERPTVGAFVPVLVQGTGGSGYGLLFLRGVQTESETIIQGILTDWEELEGWLLSQIADLFEGSDLVPATEDTLGDRTALLASLPMVLRPGRSEGVEMEPNRSLRAALLGAWLAYFFAVGALSLVLRASLKLSERRRGFVSAVTHELRTPLTTFCMYSEMLADGMVPDQEARQEYLETLKLESVRLRRIVDNVLLYARIEDGRTAPERERIDARELAQRSLPALQRRASESGAELEFEDRLEHPATLEVDLGTVEQILVNLVDNACKYGGVEGPASIRLRAELADGRLWLTVSDRGPGVPPDRRKEIFAAFRRGVDSTSKVPGIGLGLSLARAMARRLGGELRLLEDGPEPGAHFRLELELERVPERDGQGTS